MMTHKKSRLWKLLVAFSLLSLLAGCSNGGVETRREPAKTGPPIPPMDAVMLVVAAKGDNARVKDLLDRGVSVNMRGGDRNTPIMEAAFAGHLETVKLLLDRGADLSAKKNDGATPMTLAANQEIIELFNNVNALVDAASKGNNQLVRELIEKGTPLNGLDQFGHSALTESSYNGKTETVKLLLEKGANPNIKKADGATPLGLAKGQNHQDIVDLLNQRAEKPSQEVPKETVTPARKK